MRLFEIDQEIDLDAILRDCQPFLSQVSNIYKSGFYLYRGMQKNVSFIRLPVKQNRPPFGSSFDLQNCMVNSFKQLGFTANRNNSIFCTGSQQFASDYGLTYFIYPIGDFQFTWTPHIKDLFWNFNIWEDGSLEQYVRIDFYTSVHTRLDRIMQNAEEYMNKKQFSILNKKVYPSGAGVRIEYAIKSDDPDTDRIIKKDIGDFIDFSGARVSKFFDCNKVFEKIKELNYIDTDLPAAIDSGNEIMLHCKEYYALNSEHLDLHRELVKRITQDASV